MVDYIVDLGDRLQQSNFTIHNACTYLDILFPHQEIFEKRSKVIALTCLFISSKFEELDDNIPSAREFVEESRIQVGRREMMKIESELLNGPLEWDLGVVTPLSATEALLSLGVIFESDEKDNFEVPPILKC